MFEFTRPNRRARSYFSNDHAFEAYHRHRWDQPPTVERVKGQLYWKVTWADGDELKYRPEPYVQELCRLVGPECLAASIFFETGATPNGRPWGQQLWWRMRLWLAHQHGVGAKFDDDDEDADK